jgi:hypothetical protein
MSNIPFEPTVLDPPDFDLAAAKKRERSDPGICTCPACRAKHYAWGRRQRCKVCAFEFPTDAWSMYLQGVQASHPDYPRKRHEERMAHPYYRFGFLHPREGDCFDTWDRYHALDWRKIIEGEAKEAEVAS